MNVKKRKFHLVWDLLPTNIGMKSYYYMRRSNFEKRRSRESFFDWLLGDFEIPFDYGSKFLRMAALRIEQYSITNHIKFQDVSQV